MAEILSFLIIIVLVQYQVVSCALRSLVEISYRVQKVVKSEKKKTLIFFLNESKSKVNVFCRN